jgi:hypothetical protein
MCRLSGSGREVSLERILVRRVLGRGSRDGGRVETGETGEAAPRTVVTAVTAATAATVSVTVPATVATVEIVSATVAAVEIVSANAATVEIARTAAHLAARLGLRPTPTTHGSSYRHKLRY